MRRQAPFEAAAVTASVGGRWKESGFLLVWGQRPPLTGKCNRQRLQPVERVELGGLPILDCIDCRTSNSYCHGVFGVLSAGVGLVGLLTGSPVIGFRLIPPCF